MLWHLGGFIFCPNASAAFLRFAGYYSRLHRRLDFQWIISNMYTAVVASFKLLQEHNKHTSVSGFSFPFIPVLPFDLHWWYNIHIRKVAAIRLILEFFYQHPAIPHPVLRGSVYYFCFKLLSGAIHS